MGSPPPSGASWPSTWRTALTAAATLVYLGCHVPFLAWAPDDIDATNFMLALNDYDLREHQPHPPGFPVFIAMGRAARGVISAIGGITGPATPDTLDANALALCSAVFGALAAWPLMALWTALGASPRRAWLATVITMTSPLFWYSGIRPLSDLPGLAAALGSIALLVRSGVTAETSNDWKVPLTGAVIAGVAAGIRAQTLWLTAPVLGAALAVMLWHRKAGAVTALVGGFTAGVVAWAVPLTMVVGGWRVYLDVLTSQAVDDFRGAILAVDFSLRGLAFALYNSFVLPWGSLALAVAMLGLATIGAVRLLFTQPRQVAALAIMFVPYLMLHLVFHETTHTRYALPLIPAVAYLGVCGLTMVSRLKFPLALGLGVAAASTTMGPIVEQARSGSPAVQAFNQIRDALQASAAKPVVAMHHSVKEQLRFAKMTEAMLPSPLRYEWLAVVDHFRTGGEVPVWFLASRRRSDLALFDPAAVHTRQAYAWDFDVETVLGGARPRSVTWFEIDHPGWMAGEGWSLTPETRGVAERSRRGPSSGGTVAYVARRSEAAILMIGGRNLGGPCNTSARLVATLDSRAIAEWELPAGTSFLHFVDLPAGALDGRSGFAELRLTASDLSGAGLGVDVSLEQFDVQSGQRPVTGLGQGWFEPELEPQTGAQWRWTGQRATLEIKNFTRDVVVSMKAYDPMPTMGRAIELQLRSAGRLLARQRFDRAIEWTVPIAAERLAESAGRITITSDASFTPNGTQGNGDRRELALRVSQIDVAFDEARRR